MMGEASDRIRNLLNSYSQHSGFSELIVSLLRTLKANTWELDRLEVLQK